MVTGFNHSGFVVRDIDVMTAFYRDTLGLTVVREADSIAPEGDHTGFPGARRRLVFVGKPEGEHLLELVHYRHPPSPEGHLRRNQLGAAHVCFNVDDLPRFYDDLRSKGVEFVTPPKFRDSDDGAPRGRLLRPGPRGQLARVHRPGRREIDDVSG